MEEGGAEQKKPLSKRRKILTRIGWGILLAYFVISYGYDFIARVDDDIVDINNQALVEEDSQRRVDAFKEASEGAVLNENKFTTLTNLGYAYWGQGEIALAIGAFEEALQYTEVGSADYYFARGEIEEYKGNFDNALSNFNKAYNLSPDDWRTNSSLGVFYLDIYDEHPESSDLYEAIVYNERALELEPDGQDLLKENLGLNYMYLGDPEKALELFFETNVSETDYLNFWIGVAYKQSGDDVVGERYIQKSINAGITTREGADEFLEVFGL